MKKIFISIIFCTFIFFTIDQSLVKSDIIDITSFGAPPSSTGAPGESTCAQSGCHDDSQIGDQSKADLLFDNSSISSYSNVSLFHFIFFELNNIFMLMTSGFSEKFKC